MNQPAKFSRPNTNIIQRNQITVWVSPETHRIWDALLNSENNWEAGKAEFFDYILKFSSSCPFTITKKENEVSQIKKDIASVKERMLDIIDKIQLLKQEYDELDYSYKRLMRQKKHINKPNLEPINIKLDGGLKMLWRDMVLAHPGFTQGEVFEAAIRNYAEDDLSKLEENDGN